MPSLGASAGAGTGSGAGRRARTGYWFAAPATAVLLLVLVLPVFYESFVWTTSSRARVVPSVRNYAALAEDEVVRLAVTNTATFTLVSVLGHLGIGLGVALLLNQRIRGRALFRNLALLPWMLPPAVVATGWAWLYHNPFGMLNPLLTGLGLLSAPRAWLASPDTAMGAVIVANLWRGFPFISLVLLAGLQAIPGVLYEAAGVDGAGAWARFRHVTLPGLKRVLLIALTLDVINTVKYFDLIWVMTAGGPANRTEVLATLIYRLAFQFFRTGRAAALAMVMVLALAVFSAFYVRLTVRTAAETVTG